MNFKIKAVAPEKIKADLLVFFVWEGKWSNKLAKLDRLFDGQLRKTAQSEDFQGKEEANLIFNSHGKIPASFVVLLGLGKKEKFDLYLLRKATALISSLAKKKRASSIVFDFSFDWSQDFNTLDLTQAVAEGAILGAYRFLKYKEKKKQKKEVEIKKIYIICQPNQESSAKKGVNLGQTFSQATIFTRDLVNEPASVTTPTYLAKLSQKLAQDKLITCKVFNKKDCEELNMGAFLGVARGSEEPPKFINLEYKNGAKKVALVGKGITFDTGGLSMKTAEAMKTMKMDMAGGAAILGVFSVLPILKPKLTVLGFIAACENMPSGKAIKPGDVVSSFSGKTIEIVNTDAEGRLTLADALPFAEKQKPDVLIDMATLTGAIMVALGQQVAGLFGNDRKLLDKIIKASKKVGEKLWQMPLENEYKELLESEVADIKNITNSKYGGAITAAIFLQEFVKKTPWVHLDIAGPAFEEKGTSFYPKGGTGFGVRTILRFLIDY